jgi:2-iminobutanoate/2-iminopropanoate deaminase
MTVESLPTPRAWAAGPYSAAVRAGDWIVISGQIGVDPGTGAMVSGGVEAQASQALANLAAILSDCGVGWEHVAKVTLFVAVDSPQWMKEINAVYQEAIGDRLPERSTVGVSWLPLGAVFEAEAWVYSPQTKKG